MRISRLYLDTPLAEHQTISLEGEPLHYISNVLRLKKGTELSVFNGQGGEFQAILTAVNKRSSILEIGKFTDSDNESSLSITLAQGISRGERMDFTLQKATELGVNRIIPLFTERCTVSLKAERLHKRLQHWQGIIRSACEQSGRNSLPTVEAAQNFDDFLQTKTSSCQLILDPLSTHSLKSISSRPSSITILIGPEGGFSNRERELAYGNNYKGIQLGPRILRTETAAIASISAVQTLWGDL